VLWEVLGRGKSEGRSAAPGTRKTKTKAEANNARKEERGGKEPSSKRSAGWRWDGGGGGGEEWVGKEKSYKFGGTNDESRRRNREAGRAVSVFGLGWSNSVQRLRVATEPRN